MHMVAYLRPSTLFWYAFMLLARLREDLLSFAKLFILRIPLSFFWSKTNDLVLYIHNATRDLSKIPKHISFIVMEEDVDLDALSQAIIWCIVLGVSCISIADKHGLLTRHRHQLDQLVSSRLTQLNLPAKVVFYQPGNNCLSAPISSPTYCVKVAILSPAVGRQLLATAVIDLASTKEVNTDSPGPENFGVSVASLDKIILKLSGLPDADLGFRIGRTDTLFLPSPWHFRLAEFYPIDSQQALTPKTFINGLRFYSRVDQRFGK